MKGSPKNNKRRGHSGDRNFNVLLVYHFLIIENKSVYYYCYCNYGYFALVVFQFLKSDRRARETVMLLGPEFLFRVNLDYHFVVVINDLMDSIHDKLEQVVNILALGVLFTVGLEFKGVSGASKVARFPVEKKNHS